jgi:hypothetical protein
MTLGSPRLRGVRSPRRVAALTALVLATSTGLAACSSDQDSASGGGGSGHDHHQKPVPVSPLTGLPITGKVPGHPVMTVKIDNSGNSAPQVGLGGADMVAEELVEGGITRLAAFFFTRTPARVGPVRSMRATDIGVVKPLGGVLICSGGAVPTVARIKDAAIKTFTEGAPGFGRDTGRAAPYNLFINLATLAGTLSAQAKLPSPYLPFGKGALPKGQPAAGLTATFSASSSTSFTYSGGRYTNVDTNAAAGDLFRPQTVLVLRVQVGDAGYLDPAGNHVPETKFTGQGPAMVFHGGRLVRGTWYKNGLDADVTLKSGGHDLELPPGQTWVELVPADGGNVTVKP